MKYMDANLAICRDSRVVNVWRRATSWELTVPEKYCLDMVPFSHRRSIVDIGIGTGRTTGPLSEIFDKYVGIDYSREMVQAAKSKFPAADLRVMDVRSLGLEALADCVMFSFNGIDCIPYEDRQSALNQVRNQLAAGGFYIYSTHNLLHRRTYSWMNHFWVKDLFQSRNHKCIRSVFNRLRHFRRQSIDDTLGFAYVNDPALDFGMRNVYVDIAKECEGLQRHGFNVCATIGNNKQTGGYDADDNWVYIVAKRD